MTMVRGRVVARGNEVVGAPREGWVDATLRAVAKREGWAIPTTASGTPLFQGTSGGTENYPAPNDPKLGRLQRARQGLVRVPESNTKYGGKLEKQGSPDASDAAKYQ